MAALGGKIGGAACQASPVAAYSLLDEVRDLESRASNIERAVRRIVEKIFGPSPTADASGQFQAECVHEGVANTASALRGANAALENLEARLG